MSYRLNQEYSAWAGDGDDPAGFTRSPDIVPEARHADRHCLQESNSGHRATAERK